MYRKPIKILSPYSDCCFRGICLIVLLSFLYQHSRWFISLFSHLIHIQQLVTNVPALGVFPFFRTDVLRLKVRLPSNWFNRLSASANVDRRHTISSPCSKTFFSRSPTRSRRDSFSVSIMSSEEKKNGIRMRHYFSFLTNI